MGATRFFIFSTFLVLMFGFALSLPTVGDPEQGNYKFSNFYTPIKKWFRDVAGMAEGLKI